MNVRSSLGLLTETCFRRYENPTVTATGTSKMQHPVGLMSKTITLHVHHAFLYISLPSLHDYDGKMPNFTCYGGRKQATAMNMVLRNSAQKEFACV